MAGDDAPPPDDAAPPDEEAFADRTELVAPELDDSSLHYLPNRTVLRGMAAVAGALVFIAWPDRTEDLVATLVGLVLLMVGLIELWHLRRTERVESPPSALAALVAVVAGTVLAAWPGATLDVIAVVFGVALVGAGLLDLYRAIRRRATDDDTSWTTAKGVLQVVLGAVMIRFPGASVLVAAISLGALMVVAGAVSLAYILSPRHELDVHPENARRIVLAWLGQREIGADERRRIVGVLFFEGPELADRSKRFAILMALSVVIATMGVLTDSTAVVIGAMLIAPLMIPIMGTGAALIMGWPGRAAQAAITVALAVLGAVALAFLLAAVVPDVPGSLAGNSQVTSRVAPTLRDLIIAVAAGIAGAYAISRPDVSDSLPGVAVAIALVPPLAVVGITLEASEYEQALGAILLFSTNLVSIVLMGSLVFVLVGFSPIARLRQERRQLRTTYTTVGILALLIVIPLALTGQRITADALAANEAEAAVNEWLGDDTEFQVADVELTQDEVSVVIAGPGQPPTVEELGAILERKLDRKVKVDLRIIAETRETYSSPDG